MIIRVITDRGIVFLNADLIESIEPGLQMSGSIVTMASGTKYNIIDSKPEYLVTTIKSAKGVL